MVSRRGLGCFGEAMTWRRADLRAGRRWGPAVRRELHRPGDNHLAPRACGRRRRPADRPCGAAASRSRPPPRCPPAGWARDRPSRGRSLWSSSQAVLQLPRPSWACNCRAEMPLEWLVRMWMAVNQTFRAKWLRCMIRARGEGSLFAAGGALPGEALGLQRPALRAAAGGADESLRPAPPREVVRAGPRHPATAPRTGRARGGGHASSGSPW